VPTSSGYERMLRGAGLRVTRPRLALLSVVHDHPHADTDSIITAVRKRFGRVSHHAVCRSCGAIADVNGAVGDTACLTAPDASGYSDLGEAEVIYWGRCPECVAATTSSG
jgi:Fe2+ or Zn2+ uptake regulation protein